MTKFILLITLNLVTPKAAAKREPLFNQGTLKGEVSLYCRPPVWLVWNQLYDNWKFCFYLQKRLIQTGQTGGQLYSDTSPFSVPRFNKLASGPSWWVYKVFVLRILFVPSFTSWIKKGKETFFVKSIQSFFFHPWNFCRKTWLVSNLRLPLHFRFQICDLALY